MKAKQRAVLLLVLMLGCETTHEQKPIITPARTLECPICRGVATLKQFDERESEYQCEDHDVKVNRQTNGFNRAHVRYKPNPKAESN